MSPNELKITKYQSRDLLFHYTGEAYWRIILEKKLKLSSVYGTNDPRETEDPTLTLSWAGEKSDEEFIQELSEKEQKVRGIRSRLFLGCFSKSYDHPKMFAHYANSHKGCCLIFDKEKLLAEVKGKLDQHGSLYFKDVIYDRFHLPETSTDDEAKIIESLCYKDKDWKTEDEFRIIFYANHPYEFITTD